MSNTYISTIQILALFVFFKICNYLKHRGLISQQYEQGWVWHSQIFRIISACASKPELTISNWLKQQDMLTKMNTHIKNNKIINCIDLIGKFFQNEKNSGPNFSEKRNLWLLNTEWVKQTLVALKFLLLLFLFLLLG